MFITGDVHQRIYDNAKSVPLATAELTYSKLGKLENIIQFAERRRRTEALLRTSYLSQRHNTQFVAIFVFAHYAGNHALP